MHIVYVYVLPRFLTRDLLNNFKPCDILAMLFLFVDDLPNPLIVECLLII